MHYLMLHSYLLVSLLISRLLDKLKVCLDFSFAVLRSFGSSPTQVCSNPQCPREEAPVYKLDQRQSIDDIVPCLNDR